MEYPRAEAEQWPHDRPFVSEKSKLRKIIASKGLTGLANDTKWNELIQTMRADGWSPCYRCNCIDSNYISEWDSEWWHHLPFPLMSVSELDLSVTEEKDTKGGRTLPGQIDHTLELENLLTKIGFEFEIGKDVIRIFGYAPKDRSDFFPSEPRKADPETRNNADNPRG